MDTVLHTIKYRHGYCCLPSRAERYEDLFQVQLRTECLSLPSRHTIRTSSPYIAHTEERMKTKKQKTKNKWKIVEISMRKQQYQNKQKQNFIAPRSLIYSDTKDQIPFLSCICLLPCSSLPLLFLLYLTVSCLGQSLFSHPWQRAIYRSGRK